MGGRGTAAARECGGLGGAQGGAHHLPSSIVRERVARRLRRLLRERAMPPDRLPLVTSSLCQLVARASARELGVEAILLVVQYAFLHVHRGRGAARASGAHA